MSLAPFINDRLIIARERLGFTRVQLAVKMGVNPHTITDLESNPTSAPPPMLRRRLSLALGVPSAYFSTPLRTPRLCVDRVFSTMRATDPSIFKRQVIAQAWQIAEVCTHAEDAYTSRPCPFLEDHLVLGDVEFATTKAKALRQLWGFGEATALPKLAWSMENRGIRILPSPTDKVTLAAFHAGRPTVWVRWHDRCPLEMQADLALMLGHLLLDVDADPTDFESKQQARTFAYELMMPMALLGQNVIKPHGAKTPQPSHIWRLAQHLAVPYRWALARGRDLGRIYEYEHKRLASAAPIPYDLRQVSKIPTPVLFDKMVRANLDLAPDRFTAKVALHEHELNSIMALASARIIDLPTQTTTTPEPRQTTLF